jgi:hypothetical protein
MKNYIYHGTRNLIVLPGRAVQTFPSGLVRIDRTYACRTGDEGRYRRDFEVGNLLPLDDNAPAIDGAYVFPNPTEQSSDDGFYRFKVSGYGRTSTVGTYAPLNAAQASVEVDREERWITYSQEEYLVQNVCLIRSSPLQKISVAVPGRAKRTGKSFTKRVEEFVNIGSISFFEQWYETFIWQVVSTSVNYFGRVEETRIVWRYARTYLNSSGSFFNGEQYAGTALI